MPNFRYEALDANGQSRTGEIESDDVARAAALLAEQSLAVLSIELVLPSEPTEAAPPVISPLTAQATGQPNYEARLDDVLRQPQELIKLLEALASEPASAGLSGQLGYLLRHLREGVQGRQFLSDVRLCIWLPIVMSADQSSGLESRYSQLLNQVVNERNRRRSLMAAFSYPVILLTFSLLLLLPICIFIVPAFQKMFAEFGLRLPPPTRFLFSVADLVNYRPHYLVLGLVLITTMIGGCIYGWVSRALTTRWLGWIIAGNSVSLVAMSRLTSVLAELLELGAPLPEALLLAGRASRHAYYREAALKLASHLSASESGWQASPVAHSFPLTLLQAFGANEGNRPCVPLIRELSDVYSERVSARLGRRSGVSSPLMVIAVGLVVGLVVISLFMPLVSMVSSLS